MSYWDEAFLTSAYLINCLPSPIIQDKCPLEILYHKQPDYNFLKTFAYACWPHLRPYNSHKLDFRSKQCIFLGYSLHHKGYKCLDLSTNRVYFARNVLFDETLFPFSHLSAAPHSVNTSSTHVPLPSIPQPISNSPPNLEPHNTRSTSTPTASPSSTSIPSLPYSTNVNMQIPCPVERLN